MSTVLLKVVGVRDEYVNVSAGVSIRDPFMAAVALYIDTENGAVVAGLVTLDKVILILALVAKVTVSSNNFSPLSVSSTATE